MKDQEVDPRDQVYISATEPILYAGCDFRLYWAVAGLSFMSGVSLFCVFPLPQSLYAIGAVSVVFVICRWALREMAKADPLALPVYLRHIQYPAWMPANARLKHVGKNYSSHRSR